MSGRHAVRPTRLRKTAKLAAVAVLAAGSLSVFGLGADAAHEPANKVSAAGSRVEYFAPNTAITILSERVKTSKPTDLILGVSAECAITSTLNTAGGTAAQAHGQVRIWVEIDGVPVPVSAEDVAPRGQIVFCDRVDQRSFAAPPAEMIRTFQETKSATAFNWMALDVGSATHLIEVKATLVTDTAGTASATAMVGGRTLIVEPVKSANDEVVTQLA